MSYKTVLVTMRQDQIESYNEMRDSIDNQWLAFLADCQLLPVLLPNHLNSAMQLITQTQFDGILLTGGGQHTHSANDVRSQIESFLLNHAIEHSIPLMGVCRGMQVIQAHFGIHLTAIKGHVTPAMKIKVNNVERTVNSYHDYGTTSSTPNLKVWARSSDNVVKAVMHTSLPLTGVMWHPERVVPFSHHDTTLFKEHVNIL